jgi:spermidine/putrescine transport system permease protein
MQTRKSIALVLLLPSLVWLLLFLVLPMVVMAGLSLRPDLSGIRGGLFNLDWTPTLKHYQTVLGGESYLRLLWISIQVAFAVAAFATVLAYPLAYFLVFRAGRRATLWLTLAILPFWTSYLLRIIAWKTILGSSGLINSLLIYAGLVEEPVNILLYSRTAVIITLVYVWLPFVALPIYAALQRIDRSLLEAAAILGAPPWLSFLRVTLPLSLPGVIAGFFMVFIPTVGEYITPLLVGGSRGSLYGNIIELNFGDGINWPLGSAMSIVMLVGVLLLAGAVTRLVNLRRFVG